MKRMINKLFAGVCALALTFANVVSINLSYVKAEEELKIIEMYLIGGQSNAAGYSPIYENQTETFENVWYAGQTQKTLRGAGNSDGVNSDYTQTFASIKKSVTGGLGNLTDRIGPEYGMAKEFNGRYSEEAPVVIFKTAAGGTSLLDTTLELSDRYGNWYPRSLWEDGYEPDISGYSENNDATGLLYKLFVENFKRVYNTLKEKGYQPVVKGMAWMQGETDLNQSKTAYAETLKAFITDIRADLKKITGDNTLSAMPFVIGEIATSFASYDNSSVPGMIQAQRSVAEEMGDSVATVKTNDLIIVGQDGNPSSGCPDKFHFSFQDAVTLGSRFGQKLLELNNKTLVSTSAQGGNIKYALNANNSVSFTLIPNEHFKLQSLTVAGQDVTNEVVDGKYTLANAQGSVGAEAVFVEKDKYSITYADLGNGAGYWRKAKYWYEGEVLSVKIFVNDGYTLSNVTFNGEEMSYNEQTGEYEIVITAQGEISATVTKNKANDGSQGNSQGEPSTSGSGCNSVIAASGGATTLILGAAMLLNKKRKK